MRPEKEVMIEELRSKVKDSAFVILADYRGLNVAKTEELQRRLRGVKAQFQVVQNRMFKRVAGELSQPGLEKGIAGPSAMVYGKGDVVSGGEGAEGFHQENISCRRSRWAPFKEPFCRRPTSSNWRACRAGKCCLRHWSAPLRRR